MAWSSETDATQLTSVTSTEQIFSTKPTLNPGETAHVRIDFNPVATPTDDLIVNVYGSLDGTDYDDTPFAKYLIDKDTDPNQISFLVYGYYQFQVGVQATGATDTHTSVDMSYRTDGVSL